MTPKISEEEVRKRAHQFWEEHGKPEGRDEEFWHTAERELKGKQDRGEDMKGSPDDSAEE
jgi:hypothetical protein